MTQDGPLVRGDNAPTARLTVPIDVRGMDEVKRIAADLGLADVVVDELRHHIDNLHQLLAEVADWVCGMGYPVDFTTENHPPAAFQPLVAEAWVRADGSNPRYADDIRSMIAEEWL